jgi:hypothetical protein
MLWTRSGRSLHIATPLWNLFHPGYPVNAGNVTRPVRGPFGAYRREAPDE